MKAPQFLFASILLLMALSYSKANAQMSASTDNKALKKELKAYLKDLNSYYNFKISVDGKQRKIEEQAIEIEYLRSQLKSAKEKLTVQDRRDNNYQTTSKEPCVDMSVMPEGKCYQIQIGLYRHFAINQYLEKPKYLGFEQVEGAYRYRIGYFQNYQEAISFLDDIKKMGIKDAFITEYQNGERQNDPGLPSRATNTSYSAKNSSNKSTQSKTGIKLQSNWDLVEDENGDMKIQIKTR